MSGNSSTVSLPLLDQVRVAAPCPMRWEEMTPIADPRGDVMRHCEQCDLNVYNFSNMDETEVESILRAKEGRLCAGFYRRADGTILTKNCPVGVRAIRARAIRTVTRVAAVIGAVLTTAMIVRADESRARLRFLQPFRSVCERISPTAVPVQRFLAGDICIPAPPAPLNPTLPGAGTSCPTTPGQSQTH